CYHGHTDGMLVKAGSGLAGAVASDSAGVPASIAAETVVAHLDDERELEQVFKNYGSQLAAVILEPLPANYGLLLQRPEFLHRLVELARQNGSLVIFDEVISGFRVAMGGMAEVLKIKPDLVTYGKVIGGGFPVGCFGGRKDLMDLVAPSGPVYQAGTLSANPVGMAAGLATLRKLDERKVHAALEARAGKFCDDLNQAFEGLPLQVARFGSIFWIHGRTGETIRRLTQIPSSHREQFGPFFHAALKRGIYLAPSGFEVGFLSLAHTPEILDQAVRELAAAAREVYAK
ncbi:MAG TPA: aminotransferase class III-fold pyridoxal phosphate-dependent enzyme, partial [Bdellovibrionales bacterium]|nr:aminotransferase class III-fold pyridoxal phosphate-dependent enzyme [Bdellovibrionales bacterium]